MTPPSSPLPPEWDAGSSQGYIVQLPAQIYTPGLRGELGGGGRGRKSFAQEHNTMA